MQTRSAASGCAQLLAASVLALLRAGTLLPDRPPSYRLVEAAAMTPPLPWSRRRFLGGSAAAALLAQAWPRLLAQPTLVPGSAGSSSGSAVQPASRSLAPLARRLQPLLEGATARPRRYSPEGADLVIRNGREFFNRPLYGTSLAGDRGGGFRLDAGDLPEFSLYLPGQGGNLRLGISRSGGAAWFHEFPSITTRYRAGRLLYQMQHQDLLGRGSLELEVATAGSRPGVHLLLRSSSLPDDAVLVWAFGGASGRRGRRNGDLGCEVVPVAEFFQLDPEECAENSYRLRAALATLRSPAGRLRLSFPPGSALHLARASQWNAGWAALREPAPEGEALLLLAGSLPLGAGCPDLPLGIDLLDADDPEEPLLPTARPDPHAEFAARVQQLETRCAAVRIVTPDPDLNATLSPLLTAVDACWDPAANRLLESAVADRSAHPGWRGAWSLDALGHHDAMRSHLRSWIAAQNLSALPASLDPALPVRGPADPGSLLARKETLLHSNGDLAGAPCDMNLIFFDALVRHLRWTGDAAFAREAWPALLRHMDWTYRLFRRSFADPDAPASAPPLPLYESYGAAAGAQALPYNGAGVAHASAGNYFLNRAVASIARRLNEDPVPFDEEAAGIHRAMLTLLWQPDRGAFAEARDLAWPRSTYDSPALWTLCHTLDAEVATPRQSWQIAYERLSALRRVPVHGEGLPEGGYLLSTSAWFAEHGVRNTLSLAENLHAALALWQAGLPDEAFALLQGNLLDSCFRGLCPGNFHVTSMLDPFHGECGRDQADALGVASRALVEGLFGVMPDLLRGTLTVRPGFPSSWNQASLTHPDLDLVWQRDGLHETLLITSRLPQPVALTLLLPARTTSDPVVLSNGQAFPFTFNPDATGSPQLVLTNFPLAIAWRVDIRWHGRAPTPTPPAAVCRVGDPIPLPHGVTVEALDDPQGCLSGGLVSRLGHHAVFAHLVEEKCGYWLPIPLEIVPAAPAMLPVSGSTASAPPTADALVAETFDPVDLSPALTHHVTDLLRRSYTAPRSPFCSLALPEHLVEGPGAGENVVLDDAGLRNAHGTLRTAYGIPFATPADRTKPNARFLSHWQGDSQALEISLHGRAHTLYLLMTGTTFPHASHTEHGAVTAKYADGTVSRLALRTPETWWPVEQDLFLDDYLFRFPAGHPLPPRVDLRSGETRLLELSSFKGQGRAVPGGAATLLHLPLHPDRDLASVRIDCSLYGVVLALLGVTLGR